MTPFFNPGPIAHPHIPLFIAGVNAQLCRLAGEVCEGFHVHPLHTPKYIAEFILPEIDKGMKKSGRARGDIELASAVFVVAGDTPAELVTNRERIRQQIAFYASTPTYHPVFAAHGWENKANELSALASRGKWAEMPAIVSDEMLAVFAEEGSWSEVAAKVKRRYEGLLDRVAYYLPMEQTGDGAHWRATVEVFHR